MASNAPAPASDLPQQGLADWLYRFRWPLSVLLLAVVGLLVSEGWGRVEEFSAQVDSLRDPEVEGLFKKEPKLFDTRYDLWFHPRDRGLAVYKRIEETFTAEDFVIVAFEEREHPLGVFAPEALATIARLTEAIERVPYVRRVRSLTSNPWIRWGEAGADPETGEVEEGLLVSDLFEEDPASYSEAEIVERLLAVLGAERGARLLGEARVRAALGADAEFSDHLGEPRLIGGIVSEDGRTTGIQIEVLRPPLDDATLDATFGQDAKARLVGPSLFANDAQWSALDGIAHALEVEQGLARKTPALVALESSIATQPPSPERDLLEQQIANPSLELVRDASGQEVVKYARFRKAEEGEGWVDARTGEAAPDFVPEAASSYDFHWAGMPLFMRNFQVVGMEDLSVVGLMFLVLMLVLFVIFRRISGVVTPLLVLFSSVLGMFGAIWVAGDSLNNLTATTPNMVTAIGIADAVHIVSTYFGLRPYHSDRKSLLIEVLRRNVLAVFLTSVTTATGFFSLLTSEIVPMQMLGYTAGIGTIFAFLLSITLVPALLSLLPVKAARSERTPAEKRLGGGASLRSSERTDRFVDFILRYRLPIVIVGVALIAMSLVGVYRLRIDSDFRQMFPDDNPVMVDFDWIESRLGGAGDLEMVFESPARSEDEGSLASRLARIDELTTRELAAVEGIEGYTTLSEREAAELRELREVEADRKRRQIAISAEFLQEVDRFERRLVEEIEGEGPLAGIVTKISGPLDVLRKIHQVLNENRSSYYRVPAPTDVPEAARQASISYDDILEEALYVPAQDASTLAAQYYLQYENGAKPSENLATLISSDRTTFRVQGRVHQAPSIDQQAAFRRIEEIAREEFPRLAGTPEEVASGQALASLTLSGKTVLYAGMVDMFSWSLIRSLSLALAIITLLIGLIYRSVAYAILSIVPNVLPIFIPLSLFGLFGWALDGPTIIVASVALGVCVDDTVHFFTRYSRYRKQGAGTHEALSATFHHVGAPLTFTSLILVLGFGMLVLSQFTPNRLMGQLGVAMIALAWAADFFLTPALLSYLPDSPRTRKA